MLLKLFLGIMLSISAWGSERIIALSPSINEILFALGTGDQVIANTEYCNFPPRAQTLPKVGGYFSPSLEKILSMNPSLVIMQDNNADLGRKLERLHIRTLTVKIDTYHSIQNSIRQIARAVQRTSEGEAIVRKLDQKLRSLKGIVHNKRVLMVFGLNDDLSKPIFVSGQNLYFDDIIRASGNRNALQSRRKGQPVLNLENIIALNPDIVVLLAPNARKSGYTPETLSRPWRQLPITAARNGTIYVEDKDYSSNPSQRLELFLDDFKGFLTDAARR